MLSRNNLQHVVLARFLITVESFALTGICRSRFTDESFTQPMLFRQIHDTNTAQLAYLIADRQQRDAIVIDPHPTVLEFVKTWLADNALSLRYVLRSHIHPPFRGESCPLCADTGAEHIVGDGSPVSFKARHVTEADAIPFGRWQVRVIQTPGHVAGSVCYLLGDRLFCGDTLLIDDYDCRTPGATPAQMYDSVTTKLFALPDETLVFPGRSTKGRMVSTIAEERQRHPWFAHGTRESFLADAKRQEQTAPAQRGERPPLISLGGGVW